MQMAVLDLVEHALHSLIVVNQRIANTVGKPRVMDELAQALARETEVVCLSGTTVLSFFFRPRPSWQCGVRPLPNAH